MTYDVYGHLFESRDREAADTLEAARAQTVAAQDGPIRYWLHPRNAEIPRNIGGSEKWS